MLTIIIAVGVLMLAVAGIGIRLLLVKNGEFHGTCAHNNPMLIDKGVDCGTCPKRLKDSCPAQKISSLG